MEARLIVELKQGEGQIEAAAGQRYALFDLKRGIDDQIRDEVRNASPEGQEGVVGVGAQGAGVVRIEAAGGMQLRDLHRARHNAITADVEALLIAASEQRG